MVVSVLSVLSVRAFGRVTKNSARGLDSTKARTDKSDNTRKNHALTVLM